MPGPPRQSSILNFASPPPGPPTGNNPTPTFFFGFVMDRLVHDSRPTYLIKPWSFSGDWVVYRSPVNTPTLLRTGATVRFSAPHNPSSYSFKNSPPYTIVENVTLWTEQLSPSLAPLIRGVVSSLPVGLNRGSIKVKGTEHYCTFLLNKLTLDSHRPFLGAEVMFCTQTVYKDKNTFTTVYRILLDPEAIDANRAFVAPPHLFTACTSLSLTTHNLYIGDFDKGSLAQNGSPVFDHADFVLSFPPSESLDTFTLQRVIDLTVKKYSYLENRQLGILEEKAHLLEAGDRPSFISSDSELLRLRVITSFLRKLGSPGTRPPSIIINPFHWLNSDLLGGGGRFSWPEFAAWVNTFLTSAPQANKIAQVLLLRPQNLWSDVGELSAHSVPHDFGRSHLYVQHLQGTLLGSDPVNFGSFSSFPTPSITYKYASGLTGVAIASFSSPLHFSSTPFSTHLKNLPFNSFPLFDNRAADEANASCDELLDSPLDLDNPNTLVVMYPARGHSPVHQPIINEFSLRTVVGPPFGFLGLFHSHRLRRTSGGSTLLALPQGPQWVLPCHVSPTLLFQNHH